MPVTVRRRVRAVSLLLLCALLAAVLSGPNRVARAEPPPNPTDGQISNAEQQKTALADLVGELGAKVAQMQTELRQLEAAQEMAEQKLAYALSKLELAKADSKAAAHGVAVAQTRVDAAQLRFRGFVQATYMGGGLGGTTGSLLTADDPNVVLQTSALQDYESDHQLDAIGNLRSATVAKSNADAKARAAVQRQKDLTAAAVRAKQNADDAVISAQARKKQLEVAMAADQAALQRAQEQLATLNHQRAAFVAYQKEQARLRAIALAKKLAAEARARAAAAHARAVAAELERRRIAAELRRRQNQSTSGSDGGVHTVDSATGGNNGGGSGAPSAPRPVGGNWTPAAGQQAVNRAMQYLGWMYAWAGGNASGPTYGVCAGNGAFNDCHVQGFDCSGLTLYGWAPYLTMPHYAASQYWQVGSYHPGLGDLQPGDLLFWSSNGSNSGVHHVAMYVGNGNVIQAPQSGSVIQITAVGDVSWGYFGATRPLT